MENAASGLPVLYSFRRCPFAMRARLALAASGQRCELREVVLRDKPAELLAASPKGTVPVLIADGRVLDESLDIMRWALALNDPQHWLAPEKGALADMLALIARFDSNETGFKFHLDRYKYAARYTDDAGRGIDAESHRAAATAFLLDLEALLTATPFLFGTRPALADMAIAPFVRQFTTADPAWFEAQPWPRLRSWLAALLDSTLWNGVMQKYPPWRAGASGVPFPLVA
jgi:glutathione S-transferase